MSSIHGMGLAYNQFLRKILSCQLVAQHPEFFGQVWIDNPWVCEVKLAFVQIAGIWQFLVECRNQNCRSTLRECLLVRLRFAIRNRGNPRLQPSPLVLCDVGTKLCPPDNCTDSE